MGFLQIGMLALFATATSSSAQQASRYAYLANATDRIIAASESTAEPTPEAIESAAASGCGALKRLLEDRAFPSDLDRLAKDPPQRRERSDLKRDLTLFTSAFMQWEEKTLQEAGLSPKSARTVLWAVAALRDAADGDVQPERVVHAIEALRNELCSTTKTTAGKLEGQKRRHLLATWGIRIGGVLVVAANGAFAAPSGGFSVASVAIGGALVVTTLKVD